MMTCDILVRYIYIHKYITCTCIYFVVVCVCRYAIPLVQKVLEGKISADTEQQMLGARTRASGCVRALILIPSKELSQQATANVKVGTVRSVSRNQQCKNKI